MISENKRKTQLEINRVVWADVKHYATLKGLSINAAAEHLLEKALEDCGYDIAKDTAGSDGRSLPLLASGGCYNDIHR